MILVVLTNVTFAVASVVPPNVTGGGRLTKPVPVRVTVVPPAVGPADGVTLVMVGPATYVKSVTWPRSPRRWWPALSPPGRRRCRDGDRSAWSRRYLDVIEATVFPPNLTVVAVLTLDPVPVRLRCPPAKRSFERCDLGHRRAGMQRTLCDLVEGARCGRRPSVRSRSPAAAGVSEVRPKTGGVVGRPPRGA